MKVVKLTVTITIVPKKVGGLIGKHLTAVSTETAHIAAAELRQIDTTKHNATTSHKL